MQVELEDRNLEGVELDPRVDYKGERPQPMEDIKVIKLDGGRSLKIGSKLEEKEERRLVECLGDNLSVFAWLVHDIPGMDPNFMCHCLTFDPRAS